MKGVAQHSEHHVRSAARETTGQGHPAAPNSGLAAWDSAGVAITPSAKPIPESAHWHV